ncbi:MAG: ATP-binding protein [Opitutus sp.]|nr:ATP-binding protein [Opitutus sp.]
MIRLLLITEDSSQAQHLSSALSSSADFQAVHRERLTDVVGPLKAGAFEACLLLPAAVDVDLPQEIKAARDAAPDVVIVVVLPAGVPPESQTQVLSAGADSVLFQPADVAALASALTRLTARAAANQAFSLAPEPAPTRSLAGRNEVLSSALEVLRDISQVLSYSLDYRQLTQHFILKLREVIGITRIAIFLEPSANDALPDTGATVDKTRLACVAAVGLPADLMECFALSRRSGLGRQLTLHPQILRAQTTSGPTPDAKAWREFEVLGGHVAIPVNDRERTLGVAVLGGRITGGEYSDSELLLVYHLLEELGVAVKNSWLHHQLRGSHQLLGDVLNGLTVGALVVGPHQQVLYANRAIHGFVEASAKGPFDLTQLPAAITRQLHAAVEKGATIEPFFHEASDGSGRVCRATIIPLGTNPKLPRTAMLLLEDFTQVRAAQRAEIESSNLKLISVIARRFAHEIRNSLVPLTTHAQLFNEQIGEPEFRDSLRSALGRETQRIQRFTDQMLLLARSDQSAAELTPLDELLRASFDRSRAYASGEGTLEIKSDLPPVFLRCNRASFAHALEEIFLNGLQSSTGSSRRISVTVRSESDANGTPELLIEFRDSGHGFDEDAVARATEPFYTTRNTGVGLGLTIARRVAEAHHGRLEVRRREQPSSPDLVLRLPLPR